MLNVTNNITYVHEIMKSSLSKGSFVAISRHLRRDICVTIYNAYHTVGPGFGETVNHEVNHTFL